jgi:hypothetical protein
MRPMRLIHRLLILVACITTIVPVYAVNCTYTGDGPPAADLAVLNDHLQQDLSLDLQVSSSNATAIRLFYTANGQQHAVELPPVSLTPPTQRYTIHDLKVTTTLFLVVKHDSSSAFCELTVPFMIPVDRRVVQQQQECPSGYAIGGYQGNGNIGCVRVVPTYLSSPPTDFEPNKNPPGNYGVSSLCDRTASYYVIWMRAANPVFGPLCRQDDFNAVDPFSPPTPYNATPREGFPYGDPGMVRVLVGERIGGPNYLFISRPLQIPTDAGGTEIARRAAYDYAGQTPSH